MPGSLRHLEFEPGLNPCADRRLAESLELRGAHGPDVNLSDVAFHLQYQYLNRLSSAAITATPTIKSF
jgi:hypothetical protein